MRLWLQVGVIASALEVAKMAFFEGSVVRTMSAKDAKNSFGRLIDYARAEPVQVEKHGRPVVVVISVEEFQRLNGSSGRNGTKALNRGKNGN